VHSRELWRHDELCHSRYSETSTLYSEIRNTLSKFSSAHVNCERAPAADGGGGRDGSLTVSGGGSASPSPSSSSGTAWRSSRFSGLTSRCVMLRACRAASASNVCFKTLRMNSSPCGGGRGGGHRDDMVRQAHNLKHEFQRTCCGSRSACARSIHVEEHCHGSA